MTIDDDDLNVAATEWPSQRRKWVLSCHVITGSAVRDNGVIKLVHVISAGMYCGCWQESTLWIHSISKQERMKRKRNSPTPKSVVHFSYWETENDCLHEIPSKAKQDLAWNTMGNTGTYAGNTARNGTTQKQGRKTQGPEHPTARRKNSHNAFDVCPLYLMTMSSMINTEGQSTKYKGQTWVRLLLHQ